MLAERNSEQLRHKDGLDRTNPWLVIFGPENNLIPMLFKLPLSVA